MHRVVAVAVAVVVVVEGVWGLTTCEVCQRTVDLLARHCKAKPCSEEAVLRGLEPRECEDQLYKTYEALTTHSHVPIHVALLNARQVRGGDGAGGGDGALVHGGRDREIELQVEGLPACHHIRNTIAEAICQESGLCLSRCDICRHMAEYWNQHSCSGSLCDTEYRFNDRLATSLDCSDLLAQLTTSGRVGTEITEDDAVVLREQSCRLARDPIEFCETALNC